MLDLVSKITRSIPFRVTVLVFLSLFLLIQLSNVRDLVDERRGLRGTAAASIASSWGGKQTLLGPVLALELDCPWTDENGRSGVSPRIATRLPVRFGLDGDLKTELRHRGLHTVPVYRAALRTTFEFEPPQESTLQAQCEGARLRAASIVFALSDPRGIDRVSPLEWSWGASTVAGVGGAAHTGSIVWVPGTPLGGAWRQGVAAPIPVALLAAGAAPIALRTEIALRGSDRFTVLPAGGESDVRLTADWPSPSFDGAFLPTNSTLRPDGFDASWRVSELARPLPSTFAGDPPAELEAAAFGFTWYQPADAYLQTERSLKYGFLFVVLTFAVFFVFELQSARQVHPVQYGLVGAALCIFYLLLLSLSERTGFGAAYFAAAAATTLQITAYGRALLAGAARAAILGAILAALYGGLYVLIGLEETALLVGSFALFALLTLAMWLTRKVGAKGDAAAADPAGV